MKSIKFYFIFPLTALFILIVALSNQMFSVPPLGKLLDPFIGAVQNEQDAELTAPRLSVGNTGLTDPVKIYFDERKVPHVFAANRTDLYFAQGYVTAYLRLWQMDFLSYVSAGRLSEIFDREGVLTYDRKQRRLGILEAAKKSLALIEQDPETHRSLTAYTKGVNAYIGQLGYKTMPLEYKLLNYKPEAWSNLKSVLIMKYMANTLTGYDEDAYMSRMMLALGEETFNKLFPESTSPSIPVINEAPPRLPGSPNKLSKPSHLDYAFLAGSSVVTESTYNPNLGSNSWAVSGKKTKSGNPILCSDPHLNLSFPNIWIEIQLTSPEVNVYGVSIPGTPAVIIGFNENIAWGVTNGSDDVKDWYKLKINSDYSQYELDGKWLDLDYRVEEIKIKGRESFYDTVYSSVHGPIVNTKSFPDAQPELIDYALKWELHNPSNEFSAFMQLNRAGDYASFKEAIKRYACPTQNFTFASSKGTIAMHHQGKMAVRQPGQGRFLLDGSNSTHLYTRYIPFDSLPQVVNPSSNFVLSANQRPTHPGYPYYYNGHYAEIRANRIHTLLAVESKFDRHKMMSIQLDNVNAFAQEVVPVMARLVRKDSLSAGQQAALEGLRGWKGAFDADDENAMLYELWWDNVTNYTWDEFERYEFYLKPPGDYVLLDLMRREPNNNYFDKEGTVANETAADLVTEAFTVAFSDYQKIKTERSVKWRDMHHVSIKHLTNIPAFSTLDIPSPGYSKAINAISANWGPSWRMIVEMGPDRPEAYGIYPGGQSGNIGSVYYNNFVADWSQGKYYQLLFFMSVREAETQAKTYWNLN